jgi:hypothetical protein
MYLYCESSHLGRHAFKCCMNRSTTALDLGLWDPVVICRMPRYRFMAATTPLTNSGASSLRKESGTPFWNIRPVRSTRATLYCFRLVRNQRVASRVHRSTATRISPCSWHGEVDIGLPKIGGKVLSPDLVFLTDGTCFAHVRYL